MADDVFQSENTEPLLKEILEYKDYSRNWAVAFGIIYYGLRLALIVLSACAAAVKLDCLAKNAPIFSLLVAIGTSIDTWLKTGIKYRNHYIFNDKFATILTDLQMTEPRDSASLLRIRSLFQKTIEDYGVAVLPT